MTDPTATFIYDAVRTPFGKYGGALSGTRPDDLAAFVVRRVVERSEALDAAEVSEVMLGNANGAGEENRNVARMAALLAGMPVSTPGTTINRLCGSSLDAAMQASRSIAVGDAEIVVAGGVESMSRAPWVLPKTSKPFPAGDLNLASTTLGWRPVNPKMEEDWTVSLGEATERLAERYGVEREDMDEFAATSHQRTASAWDEGFYNNLVEQMPGTDLERDESLRPGSTPETLAGLKTVFRRDGGRVTAEWKKGGDSRTKKRIQLLRKN